jgi:hypothetical protein
VPGSVKAHGARPDCHANGVTRGTCLTVCTRSNPVGYLSHTCRMPGFFVRRSCAPPVKPLATWSDAGLGVGCLPPTVGWPAARPGTGVAAWCTPAGTCFAARQRPAPGLRAAAAPSSPACRRIRQGKRAPNKEFRDYNHVYLAGTPTPHPQAPTPPTPGPADAVGPGVLLRAGRATGFQQNLLTLSQDVAKGYSW